MNNDRKNLDKALELRRRAEKLLRECTPDPSDPLPEDISEVLHELRVHQTELALQNEELRRTQTELQESRDLYFDLYDLAPAGYLSCDEHGIIKQANLTVVAMLGISRSSLLGSSLARYVTKEHQDIFFHHRQAVLQQDAGRGVELKLLPKDGSDLWVHLESRAERDQDGTTLGVRTIVTNISDRKRLEARQTLAADILKHLNEAKNLEFLLKDILLAIKNQTGLEALGIRLNDGVDYPYYVTNGFFDDFVEAERFLCSRDASGGLIRDTQGNVQLECMCGNVICGRTDPGRPFFTAGGSFWSNCTTDLLASTTEADRQARTRNRCNGEGYESVALIPLRSSGGVIGLLQMNDHRKNCFTLDMIEFFEMLGYSIGVAVDRWMAEKEKDRLQVQLLQAQKMEAIGTLAGGIAHDFNNILATILGFAEMSHDDALAGKANPSDIKQIMASVQRAKGLVQQILAFSRKKTPVFKPIDLNKSVQDTQAILERTLPKMIDIRTTLTDSLPPIQADPTQMEQVLLNLASNAEDAMPEGGKLIFETSRAEFDHEYCLRHPDVRPGAYVLLTVADTGEGMDRNTLEHIFEPFYTTKEVGKGTGLGLSSAYGIIKSHGGHIQCHSEIGTGTTFQIYLPADLNGASSLQEDLRHVDQDSFNGTETILLVDDEEALRGVGSHTLMGMGYQVLTAANGEEALDVYRDKGGLLDLVIMDLGMPGMGGHKALKALLELNPHVKVLIASGYAANDQVKAALESGAVGYVAKPFERADLLAAVRSVLDGK